MRALLLEAPEDLLAERRRTGADRWDEVWDGVLHMPPPPSGDHQTLGMALGATLLPLCRAAGLVLSYETGLYRAGAGDRDYRVPDLVAAAPSSRTRRGVEGPTALVVEILSPGDESYEKLPFYARMPVAEVLLVDPDTRRVELYVLRAAAYHLVQADERGVVRSGVLGVAISTVTAAEGPRLRIAGAEGAAEV